MTKINKRTEFKKIFGFDAPICQTSFLAGKFKLNIIALDSRIEGYDNENCTFNGKENYSLKMAIEEKYGKRAAELVEELIDDNKS